MSPLITADGDTCIAAAVAGPVVPKGFFLVIDFDFWSDETLLRTEVADLLSSKSSGDPFEPAGDSFFLPLFFFDPLSERFNFSIK
jgi:hypothetical protein